MPIPFDDAKQWPVSLDHSVKFQVWKEKKPVIAALLSTEAPHSPQGFTILLLFLLHHDLSCSALSFLHRVFSFVWIDCQTLPFPSHLSVFVVHLHQYQWLSGPRCDAFIYFLCSLCCFASSYCLRCCHPWWTISFLMEKSLSLTRSLSQTHTHTHTHTRTQFKHWFLITTYTIINIKAGLQSYKWLSATCLVWTVLECLHLQLQQIILGIQKHNNNTLCPLEIQKHNNNTLCPCDEGLAPGLQWAPVQQSFSPAVKGSGKADRSGSL